MGTTLHGGDGGGKLYFLLLKLIKRKKAQFWVACSAGVFWVGESLLIGSLR